MKHIFFSAGEPSGDLHAADVIKKLDGCRISGIGGDAMIKAGMQPLIHIKETAVMGFLEVILNYPRLKTLFKKTCSYIRKNRVDLVVLVDYPGFNLKLAGFVHSLGIPVLYYIAPKVWAWGKWRLRKMRKNIDRMAVTLPFEEDFFGNAGIRTVFVGNPVTETEYPAVTREDFFTRLEIPAGSRILGLIPGSRRQEVHRILPEMVKAGNALIKKGLFDCCVVSKARDISQDDLAGHIGHRSRYRIYPDNPAPVHQFSDFLIVKSGTSTLETALQVKPFVVVYRTSLLSAFLMRRLVALENFSLANIVCGKSVVPELFQGAAEGPHIVEAVLSILNSKKRLDNILSCFEKVKQSIFSKKPSGTVARIIREMVHG
jgi:lipid-A-disaccharide synthase